MTYEDLHSSLVRFCYLFAEQMKTDWVSPDAAVVDFDAIGTLDELPTNDIVGPAEFSFEVDGTVDIEVSFGVSTNDDLNAFRLNQMIAKMLPTVLPGKSIPLVDAKIGNKIGNLKVRGPASVQPIMRNNAKRPLKFISLFLASDQTFG